MNVLLDTCTYIWLRTEPQNLSKKALELISNNENVIFLSVVSLWEINLKIKIGKLKLEGDLEKLTNIQKYNTIVKMLNFFSEDTEQISKIRLRHKDPFDLMLICQAMNNNLAILTPDPLIKRYKIKTVW